MDGLLGRRALIAMALAVCAASCSRHDAQLQHHADSLASISSSVNRMADAWLSGDTSGTYTATALQRMFLMVEQERAALTSKASLAADPRGAALADSAGELSRRIAQMIRAVRGEDAATVRSAIGDLPFTKAS